MHMVPGHLKFRIQGERIVCGLRHDSHPLIFTYSLLKEICLAFQRDVFHEVKRILCFVYLKYTGNSTVTAGAHILSMQEH